MADDHPMTETHEQRVERLARAVYEGATYWCAENDQKDHEEAYPYEGQLADFCRALARAIIASDREAGYVTVPRAVVEHAIQTQRRIEAMHDTALDAAHDLECAIAAHEQEESQDAP